MKMRTFIALELPEVHKYPIMEYLKLWSKAYTHGIRWVNPDNLHLTLLFIGDMCKTDICSLQEALFRLCLKQTSFRLKCLGFELYPPMDPKLIWVKMEAENKEIFSFVKDLTRTVRDIGYKPDKKELKLHVTVGRIKIPQKASLEREIIMSELPQTIATYTSMTLYQSILRQEGPLYIPIRQYDIFERNIVEE